MSSFARRIPNLVIPCALSFYLKVVNDISINESISSERLGRLMARDFIQIKAVLTSSYCGFSGDICDTIA